MKGVVWDNLLSEVVMAHAWILAWQPKNSERNELKHEAHEWPNAFYMALSWSYSYINHVETGPQQMLVIEAHVFRYRARADLVSGLSARGMIPALFSARKAFENAHLRSPRFNL